MTGKKVNLNI